MFMYHTVFGSLDNYEKGHIEIVNDKPRNFAFSNIFEVAEKSKPYEMVVVAKNLENVVESVRAEGESPWFSASHDEFALAMDGEIEIHFHKAVGDEIVPESVDDPARSADPGAGSGRQRDALVAGQGGAQTREG